MRSKNLHHYLFRIKNQQVSSETNLSKFSQLSHLMLTYYNFLKSKKILFLRTIQLQ